VVSNAHKGTIDYVMYGETKEGRRYIHGYKRISKINIDI